MKALQLPPQELLLEHFEYNPDTGVVTLIKARSTNTDINKVGNPVGTLSNRGYLIVCLNNKRYLLHRIIYKMVTGEEPTFVDHRDGNPMNNKWTNLRSATQQQNNSNTTLRSDNTSGLKGVSWNKSSQKWKSTICKDGSTIHLGLYNTKEEAHEAYCNKGKELFGEFFHDGQPK